MNKRRRFKAKARRKESAALAEAWVRFFQAGPVYRTRAGRWVIRG